jgi:branched-chain amino acid transport system ATP-binding protein
VEEILRVENLFLDFGGIQALSDVSLGINKGEIFSIIGPNGAGKTSLLNSISGFYRPQKGTIYFRDVNITKLPVVRKDNLVDLQGDSPPFGGPLATDMNNL